MQGRLTPDGNRASGENALCLLDCKMGTSSRDESRSYWTGVSLWKGLRSTDQRYPGDNRLILPESSNRRKCLAPRCRLPVSSCCRRCEGFGCSPI